MDTRKVKLIEYVPPVYRKFDEFKAIFNAEDAEANELFYVIDSLFFEEFIMTCSEERLSEWEKALDIIPTGTVEERRYFLKAFLRGGGKLNTERIKAIVEAFTGGDVIVSFLKDDSTILVKVLPPNNGEAFRFPDVERAVSPLVPAHLGLIVERHYSTWGDISECFADWEAVAQLEDWEAVMNWLK